MMPSPPAPQRLGALLLTPAPAGAWSPDGSAIAAAASEYDEDCTDRHSLVLLAVESGARRRPLAPGDAADRPLD